MKKTFKVCFNVNLSREPVVNHILFEFCSEEVGQEHIVLPYQTEVKWLSCGRIPSRVFKLQDEIQQSLREHEHELAGYLDALDLIQMLAYLADVFSTLNGFAGEVSGIASANEELHP